MCEAAFKNSLGDDADAGGLRHERHHLGLHIGGKARMRQSGHVYAVQTAAAFEGQVALGLFHLHAALAKLLEHGLHVIGPRAFQCYLTLCRHAGNRVSGRFNAIRNHLMFCPTQFLHAGNGQGWRSDAVNLRTHAAEKIGEVHDFRFAGRLLDDGDAFGQSGRHHGVGRP